MSEKEPSKETESAEQTYASAAEALNVDKDAAENQTSDESEVNEEFEKLNADLEGAREKMLRALADADNTRRIAQRDIANAHKFALSKFVDALLPVLDSLEQGMQSCDAGDASVKSVHEGLELTHKMFLDTLQKFGVEPIEPEGEIFNADLHEAMTTQPAEDVAPNTVVMVIQKGYLLKGRVVRAAKVIVAK